MTNIVTVRGLRAANIARQAEWDPSAKISLSYRGNELAGETGEACNIIKKIDRERLGIRGSRETVEHLGEELADVVICADLVAMAEGIDLDAAIQAKFNATSEKVGLSTRLLLAPATEPVSDPYKFDRQAVIDAVKTAMNDAWCDITSDTDCWPADLHRLSVRGPVRIEYRPAIWTDTTAEMVANALSAQSLSNTQELDGEPNQEVKAIAFVMAHQTAVDLGYPSLTEALEDLHRLKSAPVVGEPVGEIAKVIDFAGTPTEVVWTDKMPPEGTKLYTHSDPKLAVALKALEAEQAISGTDVAFIRRSEGGVALAKKVVDLKAAVQALAQIKGGA
ncbi:MazG-like family protein [Brevundimonas sp.]|uniref:MazG-like family protein n=1 Tax=Brevundimonas sp. TaxID=1871086 RepID=UPI0028A1C436|nr:MazG-like family protein [Brevundimonas sp.]